MERRFVKGRVFKDGKFWLIELPEFYIMTQGTSREDAFFMLRDYMECEIDEAVPCEIIEDENFTVVFPVDSPFLKNRVKQAELLTRDDK